MSEKNKRRIPRHVNGRIMIGPFHVKKFFMWLPIAAVIIASIFIAMSPQAFFIGILLLGLTGFLFAEIQNRETGFDQIMDTIRYQLKGDQYFERSCADAPVTKRFIANKKAKEIQRRRETKSTD